MKKLIITALAFILVLGASAPQAFAASFNNDPQDLPTVMVSKTSCNAGPGAGCFSTSVSNVSPDDVITVQIYFHNTGSQSVDNVSLFMAPQNTGSTTSQTFTGGVRVNGATVASGSASVSLNSSQTLTFISGSVSLMKTQYATQQTILNESDLFGGGVSIGSVGTGWTNQGTIRAKFRVGNNGGGTTDNCAINSFTANGSSLTTITQGSSATLAWSTSGCVNATISSIGSAALNNSGYTVTPSYTTTYALTAYGSSGITRTAQVTVNVIPTNTNYCDVTFTADQYSISQGSGTYVRWTTNGLSSVQIYPTIGNQGSSGNYYVTPTSNTLYTLTGYGCGTSYSRTVTINITNTPTQTAPQAITTSATVLSSTQARLNGIAVPNISYGTTTAWFEWGNTTALGGRTTSQNISSNGATPNPYNDVLSGLVPGRTYYYRAVVQNQNGTSYGTTEFFRTNQALPPIVTPPPVIVQPATTQNVVVAQSAPSLLELRVQSNYDTMCVGGTIDYTITYRNISNQVLQNAVLRFTTPKEVTLISASRGDYDVVERTLTIPLGTINPGEQGTITVHAAINDAAVRGNLTVTTATVVYTNSITRAQEDAIAYSLITISDTCPNVLGASVVGFGSFLPHTLLGWLLLILVILALIVLGRHFYRKTEQPRA